MSGPKPVREQEMLDRFGDSQRSKSDRDALSRTNDEGVPILKTIGGIAVLGLLMWLVFFGYRRGWFQRGTAEASMVSVCHPTVGPLCALDTTQFRAMSGGLLPLREISRSKVCDVDAKTNLPRCADLEVVKKHP